MNADQGRALVQSLTKLWEMEFPATCRVLAAVHEENRDYRPDAKSRTAWELATHLVVSDLWFLDGIVAGQFIFDAEAAKQVEGRFANVSELVEFYRREFPVRLDRVRALPAETLTQVVDFFGFLKWSNVEYIGFANNHSMHHRGQLAAYLRAMGSKVPAIYGGSADEPMAAAAG